MDASQPDPITILITLRMEVQTMRFDTSATLETYKQMQRVTANMIEWINRFRCSGRSLSLEDHAFCTRTKMTWVRVDTHYHSRLGTLEPGSLAV